jgi:hypothetical protein
MATQKQRQAARKNVKQMGKAQLIRAVAQKRRSH